MADASVDLQASNLFGLHANFNTQSSTTTLGLQNVATNDESGNVSCQVQITPQTDYTQSATYCGTAFTSDLGTFLTQFGDVQGVGVVTQLTVNMTAGDYCTVDITGHQHTENAHEAGLTIGYADMSRFIPDGIGETFEQWDGFGVPSVVTTGDDATPSSATYTFTMNHIDVNDEDGGHFVGKNITPRFEVTEDFEGMPTDHTTATLESAWDNMMGTPVLIDSTDTNDSNSEFDTFSYSGHANADLAIA